MVMGGTFFFLSYLTDYQISLQFLGTDPIYDTLMVFSPSPSLALSRTLSHSLALLSSLFSVLSFRFSLRYSITLSFSHTTAEKMA
jgi:hypothetical protein